MERAFTLQLSLVRPEVDFVAASRSIRPLAGRFYAVEVPRTERLGSVWLPDSVSNSLSSDLVVVLAAGAGVDLSPGEVVAVRPTHGDWVEGFEVPGYRAEGRVRIYGMACEMQGQPVRVAWDECAPVAVGDGMELSAKGRNVLIRRDPMVMEEGGVLLTEGYRSGLATVVSVGGDVAEVTVGDRVHYNPVALLDFLFGDDPDLAVCTEDAINAVIMND